MAKSTPTVRKYIRTDVHNLSRKDSDILTLDAKTVMKKYTLEKQAVYDRRFALKKKLQAAGLTIEQVMNGAKQPKPRKEEHSPKSPATSTTDQTMEDEKTLPNNEVMVVSKPIPVLMNPIEISFENFSIRVNGMPKKISVNPDTNTVEIDL